MRPIDMLRVTTAIGLGLLWAGCSTSSPRPEPAKTAPALRVESEANPGVEPAVPVEKSKTMPTECAKPDPSPCEPDRRFVQSLCEGDYPSVALAMFAKGTPWRRAYLRGKLQAWNASGGLSSMEDLDFDEEVILLRSSEPSSSGVVVSGGGSHQALRWNGACVTLSSGEVTTRRAPRPKQARVVWRRLEPEMRDALRENPEIEKASEAARDECRGASMGIVSKPCEKADRKLVEAIAKHVRSGGPLPAPKDLP